MTTMNNEDLAGCPHPQIIAYAIAADVGANRAAEGGPVERPVVPL